MNLPFIIAIEGIDACGKDTQCELLAKRLGGSLFRFPDDNTVTGPLIRGNLRGDWGISVGSLASVPADDLRSRQHNVEAHVRQSLMLTNRMEKSAELASAALRAPVVLCRYSASGYVYGAMDGLSPEWLEVTNAALKVQPDIYVLIDIPVEESFRRRPERQDRYEANGGFLEKVRVGYLRLFSEKQEANAARARGDGKTRSAYVPGPTWRVIDGMGSVDEVFARLCACLS